MHGVRTFTESVFLQRTIWPRKRRRQRRPRRQPPRKWQRRPQRKRSSRDPATETLPRRVATRVQSETSPKDLKCPLQPFGIAASKIRPGLCAGGCCIMARSLFLHRPKACALARRIEAESRDAPKRLGSREPGRRTPTRVILRDRTPVHSAQKSCCASPEGFWLSNTSPAMTRASTSRSTTICSSRSNTLRCSCSRENRVKFDRYANQPCAEYGSLFLRQSRRSSTRP